MNLREYTEGMENYKEKDDSENSKNLHLAFDEMENLLFQSSTSINWRAHNNKIFYCSKCFKQYFSQGYLKKHAAKCNGLLEDGICKIEIFSSNEMKDFMNKFSRISQIVQRIDFPMSNEVAIREANKTVLLLIKDKRPIGYITFCKRKIGELERTSIEDFFVLEHQRRKGYGGILFDAMLKELNIKNDSAIINRNFVVSMPSNSLLNFLIKRGYSEMSVW